MMKKLVSISVLSLFLLGCSFNQVVHEAQVGDQRLDQSVEQPPVSAGPPDEVQVQKADYQSAVIENSPDEDS